MNGIPEGATEEPELILENGSAESATVLILDIARNGRCSAAVRWVFTRCTETEERVLLSVAQRAQEGAGVELKTGTVEGVGAGLGDVVDDCAGAAAILRAIDAGDHLELLQRFAVLEEELRSGDGVVVVVLAVDFEVDGAAALAVDGESRIAIAAAGIAEHGVVRTGNAGLGGKGERIKALVDRQTSNLLRRKFSRY